MKKIEKALACVVIFSFILNSTIIDIALGQSHPQATTNTLAPQSFFKPLLDSVTMKDITRIRTLLALRLRQVMDSRNAFSSKDVIARLKRLANTEVNGGFIDYSGFNPVHFFTDSAEIVTVGTENMVPRKMQVV